MNQNNPSILNFLLFNTIFADQARNQRTNFIYYFVKANERFKHLYKSLLLPAFEIFLNQLKMSYLSEMKQLLQEIVDWSVVDQK